MRVCSVYVRYVYDCVDVRVLCVCVCVCWGLREAATVCEDVSCCVYSHKLSLAAYSLLLACVLWGVYMFEFTLCTFEWCVFVHVCVCVCVV